MSLNELTLAQLTALTGHLAALERAGAELRDSGLVPMFDLTPGAKMRITVPAVMPAAGAEVPEIMLIPSETTAASIERAIENLRRTKSTEAAPMHPAPEPVAAPAVDLPGPPGVAPFSADPSRSDEAAHSDEASAESGGGAVMAAARLPAAPVAGSASALAAQAGQWAGEWTEDQDARLIGDLVAARLRGSPKATVLAALASEFARTPKAVELRSYKLKAKVDAALATAAIVQAQTEAPEIPEAAKSGPGQGEAAAGGHSPAAVHSTDPLTAHLRGLTGKGGWSLARDLELIELSCDFWKPNEIALQLTMPANAIQPRFDALTGLHDDPVTGKKTRRWTREEVLGALLVMAGKVAA